MLGRRTLGLFLTAMACIADPTNADDAPLIPPSARANDASPAQRLTAAPEHAGADGTAMITSIVTCAATVALAIFTALYVLATWKLMKFTSDPSVIVYVEQDKKYPTLLWIVIRNAGRTVAREVSFQLSEPLPCRVMYVDKEPESMSTGPLVDGLPALAPGQIRRMKWGRQVALSKWMGNKRVYVTCKYKRGNQTLPPQTCILECRSFIGSHGAPIAAS